VKGTVLKISEKKMCFHLADTCKGRRIVAMYLGLSYARKLTSQAAVVCVCVCCAADDTKL